MRKNKKIHQLEAEIVELRQAAADRSERSKFNPEDDPVSLQLCVAFSEGSPTLHELSRARHIVAG